MEGNGAVEPSKRRGETVDTTPACNKPLGFRLTLEREHAYLRERGLSPELIERFGLGVCAYGGMTGRLCIPIENVEGKLVAYAGRWALEPTDLPAGEEKYKLPKGFHKSLELFNLHRAKACRHLYVVEGYFGAIRLHRLRVPAIALMGSSISESQVALLREHCPTLRFVSVMLDGDDAGRSAAPEVAARLAKHWWTRIVALPEGTQPDTVDIDVLEELLGRNK
jgi:DNA primase